MDSCGGSMFSGSHSAIDQQKVLPKIPTKKLNSAQEHLHPPLHLFSSHIWVGGGWSHWARPYRANTKTNNHASQLHLSPIYTLWFGLLVLVWGRKDLQRTQAWTRRWCKQTLQIRLRADSVNHSTAAPPRTFTRTSGALRGADLWIHQILFTAKLQSFNDERNVGRIVYRLDPNGSQLWSFLKNNQNFWLNILNKNRTESYRIINQQ